MPITHSLLALLVVIVWGLNFIFVKYSLDDISPLFLCTVRFILASVPAIFFIKPPSTSFKIVAGYGLIMFALQFAFLFTGMSIGMTPGITSLIMQLQVFLSILFAAIFLGEVPKFLQIIGALISFIGMGLITVHLDNHITLFGLLFVLGAAAMAGLGNLITKKARNVNMLALVVWGSFAACLPMLILCLVIEGPSTIFKSYQHLTWKGSISVFYIVYASTWVGYGLWSWLLSRHPIGTIVPFTLLVPVVGTLSSVLLLGESLEPWKLMAGLLVFMGLCVNILSVKFLKNNRPSYLVDS